MADIIREGLKSNNREIMIEAVATAAVTEDKGFVPLIKSLQSDSPDPEVKLVTAYALIKLGEESGKQIKSIASILKSSRPELRFLAAYYLSQSESLGAVDDIIRAIEIEIYPWVRREMEACLYRLNTIRRKLKEKEDPF